VRRYRPGAVGHRGHRGGHLADGAHCLRDGQPAGPAPFLGNVSLRFRTPVAATVISGVILIILTWLYLFGTSIQAAFTYVIDITGLLYASFYILTALAAIVYYRRRVFGNFTEFLTLGLLPLGAVAFLGWVIYMTCRASDAAQNWTLAAVAGVGVVLMFVARFGLRSAFFSIPRESDRSRR
jgi:amino acid transporter